ncbi:hypothetical protein P1P75_40485 [Streptomyces sp. ID05-39B]|nr:hypothetical protein [Streptomyces sp. ID05-39B]MDX3532510.1 hypothetical protein [Streptomyces sp. ID05-39B]
MEESTTPGLYALTGLVFLALGVVFFLVLLAHATRSSIRYIRTRTRKEA